VAQALLPAGPALLPVRASAARLPLFAGDNSKLRACVQPLLSRDQSERSCGPFAPKKDEAG